MRILADTDRCIGSGNCARIMPDVFDQDDDGVVALLGGSDVDEELLVRARVVVQTCPTNALRLEEGPSQTAVHE